MSGDNPNRCTATSKVHGGQCKRLANRGSNVCRYHGGAAPQVKEAARRRLAAMVDPALGVLQLAMTRRQQIGKSKTRVPDKIALEAARDVLDRAGYQADSQVRLPEGGVRVPAIQLIFVGPGHALTGAGIKQLESGDKLPDMIMVQGSGSTNGHTNPPDPLSSKTNGKQD